MKKFLNSKGAVLCDFVTVTDQCLPLVAPGKALDDLILYKPKKEGEVEEKSIRIDVNSKENKGDVEINVPS